MESKPRIPRPLHAVQTDSDEEQGSVRVTTPSLDELIRAALHGLSEAAERFDPRADTTFTAFARWWIERSMRAASAASPAEAA